MKINKRWINIPIIVFLFFSYFNKMHGSHVLLPPPNYSDEVLSSTPGWGKKERGWSVLGLFNKGLYKIYKISVRVSKNVPEWSRMFPNALECSGMFYYVPEFTRNSWEDRGCMSLVEVVWA